MIGIRIVATLVAALAVFGAAAPPLAAAQTLQQVQSVGEWTAEFNRVLTTFITPLQAIPAAPEPRMTRRERQDWAAAAREWGTNAQGAFASARMDLQRMPPSPPAHDAMSEQLRTAVEQALPRLREAFDAGDRVAAAYLAMADAVERNQMDRIASVRGAAIEASMITMRLFQDINATQAAAMQQGNPQRPLIQSYAISYEAVWAFLNFKREILNSGAGDRQDAAPISRPCKPNSTIP